MHPISAIWCVKTSKIGPIGRWVTNLCWSWFIGTQQQDKHGQTVNILEKMSQTIAVLSLLFGIFWYFFHQESEFRFQNQSSNRLSAKLQIRRKNILFTSGYSEYPTYILMYVYIYIYIYLYYIYIYSFIYSFHQNIQNSEYKTQCDLISNYIISSDGTNHHEFWILFIFQHNNIEKN